MDGTVPPQLFQFSEWLSELQSLLANQNKIHAALQETLHNGLLLKDHELEYQRQNNQLKELISQKSKHIDMPKEILHSHLKMDVKPPITPSSFPKIPIRDSNSAVKFEKMDVKIPMTVATKLEDDDKGVIIDPSPRGRKRRMIPSNNNGNDPNASSSQKLKTSTGPVNTKQVSPTITENSDESADSVELNRTPAPARRQTRPRRDPPKQCARKSTGGMAPPRMRSFRD